VILFLHYLFQVFENDLHCSPQSCNCTLGLHLSYDITALHPHRFSVLQINQNSQKKTPTNGVVIRFVVIPFGLKLQGSTICLHQYPKEKKKKKRIKMLEEEVSSPMVQMQMQRSRKIPNDLYSDANAMKKKQP
jgi:hypothetical protein